MYKIRTFRTHESTNAVTFMETGEDEEGGKRLPLSSFSLPKPTVALSLSLCSVFGTSVRPSFSLHLKSRRVKRRSPSPLLSYPIAYRCPKRFSSVQV